MKKLFSLLIILSLNLHAQDIKNKYLQNQTVTYQECIDFYEGLAKKYPNSKLVEYGKTDVGIPLHLFMITNDQDFDIASIKNKNKVLVLINNGIHAGEPCGVDACLGLSEDLLTQKDMTNLLKNIVVCIIPFYNIDGALNRSCCSRANQNGPQEYGFRANARNLDLNRDFIKCDAQNTKSLIEIIQNIKPQVFIDTHISNGADYSYNMTLITTQYDKLNPILSNYLKSSMLPSLQQEMKLKNNEMCPYVETLKETPDSGLVGFLESPRFATGYTALHNIIGFVTEAHMLKPYPIQVKATYDLLLSFISTIDRQHLAIIDAKNKADEAVSTKQTYFALNWELDTSEFDLIDFKGYAASYKKSNISGLERLYYDKSKPFNKKIKYFNKYIANDSVSKPKAYIVPQAWSNVIALLKLNKVQYKMLEHDTIIEVNCYSVEDYKTTPKPYEGHYLHSNVTLKNNKQTIHFYAGDYLIWCNQNANRFIIETLEPKATDSYFNWNYFDSALQQKEWFSDYVYEETAEKLLKEDPNLRREFEKFVKERKVENNHWEQLAWIFKHAPHYEKTAYRYPVFRIE
jgi:hypothetical protein